MSETNDLRDKPQPTATKQPIEAGKRGGETRQVYFRSGEVGRIRQVVQRHPEWSAKQIAQYVMLSTRKVEWVLVRMRPYDTKGKVEGVTDES